MTDTVKITALTCNPDNPRYITEAKFKRLCNSLRKNPRFMEERPIVERGGIIGGGNMRRKGIEHLMQMEDKRFRAALKKHYGITEPWTIPAAWVRNADWMTDEEFDEFVIADNGDFGDWDHDMMANRYGDYELPDLGYELPELGGEEGPELPPDPTEKPPKTETCPECGHTWEA